MRVVIIEQSKERCELLADLLPDATVVNGDGTSKNLLFEENLENAEAFVALTNMDEENILLGMFAERMSHAKVVTKVNRVAFDDITDELELGSLIQSEIYQRRIGFFNIRGQLRTPSEVMWRHCIIFWTARQRLWSS